MLKIHYVSVCFSDYLSDHCCHCNEALYSVEVDSKTKWRHVIDAMRHDLPRRDDLPESVTDADIEAAIDAFVGLLRAAKVRMAHTVSEYAPKPDQEIEYPYVWFRLSWKGVE